MVTRMHILNGLSLGEQCVYILPQKNHAKFISFLKQKEPDIATYLASAQLILLDSAEKLQPALNKDPKQLLAFLKKLVVDYEKVAMNGLRIVMDMNWVAKDEKSFTNLVKFERLADTKLLQESFTSIISEYDINEFPPNQVEEILHAYPYAIIDQVIHQNIYYIPDLKLDTGEYRMQSMFTNITNYTGALQSNDSVFLNLMNSLNDVVLVLDADQKIVNIYGKWFKHYGIVSENLIGKTLAEITIPEDVPLHLKHMTEALHGKNVVYEWQGISLGKKFHASISLSPLRDNSRKIVGIVGIAYDITERKLDDQKIAELLTDLEQNKERLENIVSTLPGVVWESQNDPASKEQKITYISNYVEEMLGYPVKDWLTVPNFWSQIVHPEDRQKAIEVASGKFNGSNRRTNQFRWITKDGREIWVEAQSVVVKDKRGNPIGMRGVNLDITTTKLLEKQKDEFVSVASHELKTPITTIKAFVDLLKIHNQKSGDQKSLDYLTRVDNQVTKVTKLVHDMLDVSRIQAGKLDFNFSNFDIYDLVVETVNDMQLISTKHKLELVGKVKHKITGDRYRLAQVLTNLISNSIKYSPTADKIIILMQKDKTGITISVQDFGMGISKVKSKMIFERFYRVNDSNLTNRESLPSLGLGLYISSEIMMRHKGEIWVESEEGKGSIFYIKLPL